MVAVAVSVFVTVPGGREVVTVIVAPASVTVPPAFVVVAVTVSFWVVVAVTVPPVTVVAVTVGPCCVETTVVGTVVVYVTVLPLELVVTTVVEEADGVEATLRTAPQTFEFATGVPTVLLR